MFGGGLACHTKSVKISSRYDSRCRSFGQTAGFAVADIVSGRKLIYVVHTCCQVADIFKSTGIGNSETTEKCGTDTDRIQIHIRKTDFVFDEPTIGLHPLDVQTLLGVFQALVDQGATVLVIEHDLDVIRNAD